MKFNIILLILFLCISCESNQNNQRSSESKPDLENTDFKLSETSWIVNVSDNCIDTLKFKTTDRLSFYHCGLGVLFDGNYVIKEDLVSIDILDYISQVDITKGKETVLNLELKYARDGFYVNSANGKTSEFNHLNTNTHFYQVSE